MATQKVVVEVVIDEMVEGSESTRVQQHLKQVPQMVVNPGRRSRSVRSNWRSGDSAAVWIEERHCATNSTCTSVRSNELDHIRAENAVWLCTIMSAHESHQYERLTDVDQWAAVSRPDDDLPQHIR